mgnify:CR=1 FL=1
MAQQKRNRREEILQALAAMLETSPGQRITTAKLAASLGVSEAALYRHFPSKARMFEGLIEFVEDTLLTRINLIMSEEKDTLVRCQAILQLLLTFAERNPGLCCVLTGDALMGEDESLRKRASQFFERLETQIRQALKEGEIRQGLRPRTTAARGADFVMVFVEGRIQRFVRSSFSRLPTSDFDEAWGLVSEAVWG